MRGDLAGDQGVTRHWGYVALESQIRYERGAMAEIGSEEHV